MKLIKLQRTTACIIELSLFLLVFLCTYFLILNIKAEAVIKKALISKNPTLRSEKLKYYKRLILLTDQATDIVRDNSDYYNFKADYITKAGQEGFLEELNIKEAEIKKLYLKAISLNLLNYEYYWKLGLFYLKTNDLLAEKNLLKSSDFFPTNFSIHTDLAGFYFRDKDVAKGFHRALKAFYYAIQKQRFTALSPVFFTIKQQIKDIDEVIPLKGVAGIKYTLTPKTFEFDLKKEGFPRLKIPLKFRVYLNNPEGEVEFYKGPKYFSKFSRQDSIEDQYIHEKHLNEFSDQDYLDDFIIRSNNFSDIEKIEIINEIN